MLAKLNVGIIEFLNLVRHRLLLFVLVPTVVSIWLNLLYLLHTPPNVVIVLLLVAHDKDHWLRWAVRVGSEAVKRVSCRLG